MGLLQAVHLQMTKTATIQYKPVMSVASNNNALHITNSHVAMIKIISHALSNIYGLYMCSCNLCDIIFIYISYQAVSPMNNLDTKLNLM